MESSDEEMVDSLEVKPVVDNKPLLNGELVGEVLSVISHKDLTNSDPDVVVKRNSFRDLHHPDISYIDFVKESDSKEEVWLRRILYL